MSFTLEDKDGQALACCDCILDALMLQRGMPEALLIRRDDGAVCAVRPSKRRRGGAYAGMEMAS